MYTDYWWCTLIIDYHLFLFPLLFPFPVPFPFLFLLPPGQFQSMQAFDEIANLRAFCMFWKPMSGQYISLLPPLLTVAHIFVMGYRYLFIRKTSVTTHSGLMLSQDSLVFGKPPDMIPALWDLHGIYMGSILPTLTDNIHSNIPILLRLYKSILQSIP